MEVTNTQTGNSLVQRPNNNMTLAVIATVLGCLSPCFLGLILGGVGIYFASTVNNKFDAGEVDTAIKNAKTAKIMAFIALGLVVLNLIYIGVMFAVQGPEFLEQYQRTLEQMQGN